MAELEDLLIDRPGEWLLRVTLNRPESRNALRTQTLRELAETLAPAAADDSVRCVILTGGPQVFAAGADVRELADKSVIEALRDERALYWRAIRDFPKPLVAGVNGYCLGGGNELAMLCDLIIAGEGAKFGQPEIKLGLIPGAGGTQRLVAALGKARAMRYLLTGEFLSGREAFDAGLVSEVVADDQVEPRALWLAKEIASKSPQAARFIKEVVRQTLENGIENGLGFERRAFALLFATEDRKEGVAAFLEKRLPEFQGT